MPYEPPSFFSVLNQHGLSLTRNPVEICQVNLGRLCNQACLHCHVEAGPKRTELMDTRTTRRVLELIAGCPSIHTVDITGGAPEMNPNFQELVAESRKLGKDIIDRCNLTIFFEPSFEWIPEFLAEQRVTIIASLPCYTAENVDKQRGSGVFEKSICALRLLNELGYGSGNSNLQLHLVYNPTGASLPPAQDKLKADYKDRLLKDFDITFDELFTITNMPIKRFLHQLRKWGKEDEYFQKLVTSFNPHAATQIMCRNLLSIGWQGEIYDCDFNQMLELPTSGQKRTIYEIDSFDEILQSPIITDGHCFGCTAGAGSSCSGSLVTNSS